MSETKRREPLVLSPLEDEPATENLPEPIPLTPEQIAAQAEADERGERRRLEWALVVQALSDNSFAHLKRILKLDRSRLRGPCGARDEFHLAAIAQNLRKLAKLIPVPAPLPAA